MEAVRKIKEDIDENVSDVTDLSDLQFEVSGPGDAALQAALKSRQKDALALAAKIKDAITRIERSQPATKANMKE